MEEKGPPNSQLDLVHKINMKYFKEIEEEVRKVLRKCILFQALAWIQRLVRHARDLLELVLAIEA